MGFRITTWNVNGIRNPFSYHPWCDNRTYESMFAILQADIVVLQECKIQRKDLTDDMVLVPGWDVYFSLPLHKKGYAGVAVYTRSARCAPIRAEEGLLGVLPSASGCAYRDLPAAAAIGGYPSRAQLADIVASDDEAAALDAEGRCVVLEFPGFVLLGVYAAAQRDASRAAFRAAFFAALDVRVRNLVALGKHVVVAGDLNVTRDVRDSCGGAEALAREGISAEEFLGGGVRRVFNEQLFNGAVVGRRGAAPVLWDLCREAFAQREGMFTCWDTKRNTRPANNGSRIDYVLCSAGIRDWVATADIQPGLMGSDHCPVYAELHDRVRWRGVECAVEQAVNPPGRVDEVTGVVGTWTLKDALALSGRLIPEFTGRRNIRDMFMRAGSVKGEAAVAKGETAAKIETEAKSETTSSKRPASTAFASPARAAKKARAQPTRKNTGVDARQSTLRGFFAPKQPASVPGESLQSTRPPPPQSTPPPQSRSRVSQPAFSSTKTSTAAVTVRPEGSFDAIEAKESWRGLLARARSAHYFQGVAAAAADLI
uniref:AP endonuclease protein 2 n=1 Tax=Thielaviopsis paradoxa TaxID=13001 RepID=A0A2R4ZMS1_9PEZI|nr:TPA_exp: AP endonuclease protein 2 [Thielaviopsis paradoxa]